MANIVRASSLDRDPRTKDFRNFLYSTWMSIGLPKPTPLQYDMAEYLQEGVRHGTQDVGDRKELMAFRGASKSYVTTAFGVWRLKRDRSERVLVTSATAGFAGGIATFAYNMVRGFDWLADMKPASDQRQSALAFDVAGAPVQKDESFKAESIFGQITGRRASIIIGDDLETPNTSDTEGNRTELRKRMGEFGAIILPGGDIYLLGTSQTEQTVYREYADEKGYELRIYPILYPIPDPDPKRDEIAKYNGRLAPFVLEALRDNPELAGTSIEPSRFNAADIASRRLEWGTVEFERQFKMFLDAGAGTGTPLKLRDLIVMPFFNPPVWDKVSPVSPYVPKLPAAVTYAPIPTTALEDIKVDSLNGDSKLYAPSALDTWLEVEETTCFVDTSGEGKDETSWSIGAGLLGRVALLHQGASMAGHTPETMMAIAMDCARWGVRTVEVEANFGGTMFAQMLIATFAEIGYKEVDVQTKMSGRAQKEKRIVETLEPVMSAHRLLVNADVMRKDYDIDYPEVESAKRRYYRLSYQLSRITKVRGALKHDDRADSLAGLVAHFVEVLQRAQADAAKAGREKAIELEAEKIIEARKRMGLSVLGDKPATSAFGRPDLRSPIKRR